MAKEGSLINDILNQVFTYRALVHAISGATGGVSAITVFYPLNKVRIVLQIDAEGKPIGTFEALKRIVVNEGWQSLFQGWVSSVVSLGTSNFVYFYTYNGMKVAWQKHLKSVGADPTIDPIRNLVIASAAGVLNVFMTTPLWVVGTRLTVQPKHGHAADKKKQEVPYKGVIDGLVRITREEGIAALWKGLWPSLWLVSNPSIQFVAYEQLKRPMTNHAKVRGYPITSLEFFIMGAIAKAVATVLTYPLQIAQARLRADKGEKEGQPNTGNYKGTIDCLIKIFKREGALGWFKGMEAKLWQTVLTAAFQFLTYEKISRAIFWLLLNKEAGKVSHGGGGGGR